ncbi:hypothetical protein EM595_1851 [Duffyella gerundensis]|uniref:Uncharacterized protein n=1 Tax=Duffyella gerundensis TaxID=1619313 RepID=A0A0U5L4U8_9GAMM|nr:hypothetical protein EM595_1851 [Duffyella gerundensis]
MADVVRRVPSKNGPLSGPWVYSSQNTGFNS